MEDYARHTHPTVRKVESDVDATTEKLQRKFGESHWPLPDGLLVSWIGRRCSMPCSR